MMKVKPELFFTGLVMVLFLSCAHEDGKGRADSTGDTALTKIVVPKKDSVPIDIAGSSFACTRSKTVKDFEKEIMVFGSKMKVKMDNASFTAQSDIAIAGGNWYTIDGKLVNGRLVLDMISVEAVKIGEDQRLAMGNPDYLDTKNFPYAFLDIGKLQLSTDSSAKKNPSTMEALLTLKGITDTIIVKNVKFRDVQHDSGIPGELNFDFQIDGIQWGLNRKDAKVTKDELKFHVIMKAVMK